LRTRSKNASTRLRCLGLWLLPLHVFLASVLPCRSQQASIRTEVEAVLESRWTNGDTAHEAIQKLGDQAFSVLISVATNDQEPYLRRWRAVFLLGKFDTEESADALAVVADSKHPLFRCYALQSIANLDKRRAIPVLIRKLDDQSVCMNIVVTDPAREYDVYVSDEAVRLLELVTARRFQKQTGDVPIRHRATKPWKKWWERNRKSYQPN